MRCGDTHHVADDLQRQGGRDLLDEVALAEGRDAWDAVFGTVTLGKFFLGFGSIGICEHAFHEAITHADARILYGRRVTDFPHVRQAFVDAYARLVAMKLFGERAIDYMRSANADDRRYLLFNPITNLLLPLIGIAINVYIFYKNFLKTYLIDAPNFKAYSSIAAFGFAMCALHSAHSRR